MDDRLEGFDLLENLFRKLAGEFEDLAADDEKWGYPNAFGDLYHEFDDIRDDIVRLRASVTKNDAPKEKKHEDWCECRVCADPPKKKPKEMIEFYESITSAIDRAWCAAPIPDDDSDSDSFGSFGSSGSVRHSRRPTSSGEDSSHEE